MMRRSTRHNIPRCKNDNSSPNPTSPGNLDQIENIHILQPPGILEIHNYSGPNPFDNK